MKKLIFSLLFPALLMVASFAHAQSEQSIIERYRLRYKDFFERQKREDRREQVRLSGRDEVKEERLEQNELLERARKQFAANRKPKKDDTAEFQRHLELEAKLKRAQLKREEEYSIQQRRIEQIKKGAIQIPPVEEYQLQDAL